MNCIILWTDGTTLHTVSQLSLNYLDYGAIFTFRNAFSCGQDASEEQDSGYILTVTYQTKLCG